MKNFVQEGQIIKFVAGATLLSGAPVVLGGMVGINVIDVVSGEVGEALICKAVEVDKVSAQAWTLGQRIYYDASLAKFTNVQDTDTTFAGLALEAAANPTAKGKLILDQGCPQAALVSFSAGSNLVGVDGTGSNAAPLAGTETRLDSLDTAVAAIILAMKNAGLMASS